MHRTRSIAAAATALAALVVLSGCGGGGGAAASGCGTDLTATIGGTGVDITSTAAVSLQGGAAYTLYAADFDLDAGELTGFTGPAVPDGNHLMTVAITVFDATGEPEPIEAGTVVPTGTASGELVFVVTANEGATLLGNSTGATGELTVVSVGDEVCLEIEYSDGEKELSGTVGAAVKRL